MIHVKNGRMPATASSVGALGILISIFQAVAGVVVGLLGPGASFLLGLLRRFL